VARYFHRFALGLVLVGAEIALEFHGGGLGHGSPQAKIRNICILRTKRAFKAVEAEQSRDPADLPCREFPRNLAGS
jgi:hypothetical protein